MRSKLDKNGKVLAIVDEYYIHSSVFIIWLKSKRVMLRKD